MTVYLGLPGPQVTRAQALPFLETLAVGDIPGVGWSNAAKLEEMGITQVRISICMYTESMYSVLR